MADFDPDQPIPTTDERAPPAGALLTLFRYCVSGLNALGSGWIFVLMILINIDALGRTFFNQPLQGALEIVEMSIVAIVFLQIADAVRVGKLTRSDGLFNLMLARRPKVGRAMGVFFDGVGAIFMAIVLYGSVPYLLKSITEGYFVGEHGLFTFPTWPIKLVICIAALFALLQFLVFAYRYIRPPNGAGGAAASSERI